MTTETTEHPADRIRVARARLVEIAGTGVVVLAIAFMVGGGERFLRSYLTSFAFVLSISLGALFFVILQHLTRSGWSVVVRRLAEALARNLLLLAVLFVPVIVGLGTLYPWSHETDDPLILHKAGWLNPAFFVVRAAVYFGIWVLLARFFHRSSVRQDETGDPALSLRMQARAPVAMVLYGITVSLAAFDLLMSLDPHWFSTIFGVYYFSGAAVAVFAALILTAAILQARGRLRREITEEHYHDLGKQLFGYVVFWAYIAFSQYMLIWYANLPEETEWFLTRQTGGWQAVGLILLFGHFLLPFLALLPRAVKRRRATLVAAAVWLLAMHWVDLFWLTVPGEGAEHVAFSVTDLLCLIGLSLLFLAGTLHHLGRASLLAARDPRLPESLAFENV